MWGNKHDPSLGRSNELGAPSKGQSLVEFALVLPVLMLILLGIIDLGRVFNAYVAITNASREAARYGGAHVDKPAETKARAIAESSNSGVTVAESNVDIACFRYSDNSSVACSSAYTGDQLRVTVTTSFEFLTLSLFRLPSVGISNFTIMPITAGQTPP